MKGKLAAFIVFGILVATLAPLRGLAAEPLPGPYEHSEGSSCPPSGRMSPLLMCQHTATASSDGSFMSSVDIDSGSNGSIPQPLDGRSGYAMALLSTSHSIASPVSRITYRIRLDLARASRASDATIGSAAATTSVQVSTRHESCETWDSATFGSCWTMTSVEDAHPGVMTFELTLDPGSAGGVLEPGRVRIFVQAAVHVTLHSAKQHVGAGLPTRVCLSRWCIYGVGTEMPLATQGYARGVLEGGVISIEAVV